MGTQPTGPDATGDPIMSCIRWAYNKKVRPNSYIKNTADEVQVVLNELQSSPFIRSVIANDNGKPPGVIR